MAQSSAEQRERTPTVDVIIAVHSATRPIARAVHSVLAHTVADVRVIVVAHNIDPAIIRTNLGELVNHPDVWLTELHDGIRSPAGPMNYGLDISTARFTSLLGSDDEFAPGAIDSWLESQRECDAQAVLARITLPNGRSDPYPPVRFGRRMNLLDPVQDRLAYRSAPLGLIERRAFGSLRLTAGLESGEDLVYSLSIWFTAERLAYDLHNRGYVIHADSTDRVTFAPREISLDFAFLAVLDSEPWFVALSRRARVAIVLKMVRIHLFDAIASRVTTDADLAANRDALLQLAKSLFARAPHARALISRADARVLQLLARPTSTPSELLTAINDRHRLYSFATMLPAQPLWAAHRQAPFRTLFSGFRIQKMACRSSESLRPPPVDDACALPLPCHRLS
ncbi:MAG: glycosyltransferase family A protein [Microbacteriaceae bacterium]